MSLNDQLLEDAQCSVDFRLRTTADLCEFPVHVESLGTTADGVAKAMLTQEADDQRSGLTIYISQPTIATPSPTAPGPPIVNLGCEIDIFEHVEVNRGESGFGVTCSQVALRVLNAMHLFADPVINGQWFGAAAIETLPELEGGIVGMTVPLGISTNLTRADKVANVAFDQATDLITLSCATPGAEIWYNTQGAYPIEGEGGTLYTGPFTITETTDVRAVAHKSDMISSNLAWAIITLGGVDRTAATGTTLVTTTSMTRATTE